MLGAAGLKLMPSEPVSAVKFSSRKPLYLKKPSSPRSVSYTHLTLPTSDLV